MIVTNIQKRNYDLVCIKICKLYFTMIKLTWP